VFSFVAKNFPEGLIFPEELDKNEALFLKAAEEAFEKVGQAIEAGKFHEGLNLIFKLVEKSNHYLNDTSPWTAIKTDRKKAERSLAITGHIIKCISVLISPYLPKTSQKISLDIDFELKEWSYPKHSTLVVHNFKPLYKNRGFSNREKKKKNY